MRNTKIEYIRWQNRAFRFYLAARLLAFKGIYGPATFCGYQAIELLLKATLIYWDGSFKPEMAGHKVMRMLNAVRNKVPNGRTLAIPKYFFAEQRFQSVSRYPSPGRGLGVPASFVDDLDRAFFDLVSKVPFQFNSELLHALRTNDDGRLFILRRKNKQMRGLRKYLAASRNSAA